MNKDEINNIVRGLKNGDRDSFSLFYEKFERIILNHIYRMTQNREVSQDLFQEVIILIIEKINFYSEKIELENSFKAWCLKIATNKTIDYLRSLKRKNIPDNQVAHSAEKEFSLAEDKSLILNYINELPSMQKLFLSLRVEDDLSLKEISIICECSVNTVKQGLFRARKKLSTMMLAEDFV